MKIEKSYTREDEIKFIPETDMDLFYIGVISSKNECRLKWKNNKVEEMMMFINSVVIGLARKEIE